MAIEIDIDIELLINLVKERPVLWDRSYESYKDRNRSKKAWNDICLHIKKDYNDYDELTRKEIARSINAKWNNLRDNWMKSYKKIALEKRTAGGRKSRKYIYYHQLEFLEGVVNKEILSTRSYPSYPHTNQLITKRHDRLLLQNHKSVTFENRVLHALDAKNKQPDHHLLFFESILPAISKFNEAETLEFRIDVLNLIKSIKHRDENNLFAQTNGAHLENNKLHCEEAEFFHKQEVSSPPPCDTMEDEEFL